MKKIPEHIKIILESFEVKNSLDSLRKIGQETKLLIKNASPNIDFPTLRSNKNSKDKISASNHKSIKDFIESMRKVKIIVNDNAFEKYEVYCLNKGFTPSDFFLDLLYLIDSIEDALIESPEIELGKFAANNAIIKKILGR
jgi:hypothetical protein